VKILSLLLSAFALLPGALHAQNLTGDWQGTLKAGPRDLRVVFKISRNPDETLKAQMISVDQGGQPIPVSSVTQNGPGVKLKVDLIGGSFEGALNADATSLSGTWTQGPAPLPLTLARATPQTAWAIPEPPPPPKAMAADADPAFEVATIKPSRPETQGRGFTMRGGQVMTINTSVSNLISFAYDLHDRQISGGPAWMESDKFDITGKPDAPGQPNLLQMKAMVRKLLADRFQLKFHMEKKELSVYAIVPGKAAHKLTKNTTSTNAIPSLMFPRLGMLPARNATLAEFAQVMQSAALDRPVVDQTGLQGRYDFTLTWTPDEFQFTSFGPRPPQPAEAATAPDLFTAFQEQLGLKLEGKKAPADVLVVDRAEKPSEN